jgi:hypothetical protein
MPLCNRLHDDLDGVNRNALEVAEIAPGIDLEKDVLARIAFKPRVSCRQRPRCAPVSDSIV